MVCYTPRYRPQYGLERPRWRNGASSKGRFTHLVRFVTGSSAQRRAFENHPDSTTTTLCVETAQQATSHCSEIYDEVLWSTQTPPEQCELHKAGHGPWSLFRGLFKKKAKQKPSLAN